ncbi:MAG: hypothetical protein A3H96_12400 [Acidobacteria bacterium RIFCSPLOWO2_02_FULL_67_36]|nr:MAG: hypothetical protein A3H96_12400 [Acidobacteria bacterium RIFCSPLOWO2_02_FULL_67_36]
MAICAAVLCAAFVDPAEAQWIGRTAPHTGSVEVSGGALWSNGFDLGDSTAEETRNINSGTGPFGLFSTSSRLAPAPGGVGRLSVYVTRDLAIEAGVEYARPQIRTRVSDDAEGADAVTATERIARYVFNGSVVWHLPPLTFAGGKGVPFVLGGGGYLRELHEGNELLETGREYHAGAGLKYWFGDSRQRLGLRADVQISMRKGGVNFGTTRRAVPTGSLSLAYLF